MRNCSVLGMKVSLNFQSVHREARDSSLMELPVQILGRRQREAGFRKDSAPRDSSVILITSRCHQPIAPMKPHANQQESSPDITAPELP